MDGSAVCARGRVGYNIRLYFVVTYFIFAVAFITSVYKNTLNLNFLYSVLIILCAGLLVVVESRGYMVCADDTGVSVRPSGFLWLLGRDRRSRILYADISTVAAQSLTYPRRRGRGALLSCFGVHGLVEGPAEWLVVSPDNLDPYDAREVLRCIRDHRPDTVSEEVSNFIDQRS